MCMTYISLHIFLAAATGNASKHEGKRSFKPCMPNIHMNTCTNICTHTDTTLHTSWRGRPFSEARKASRCLKRSSACASSPTSTAAPSMSASTSTKSWCDCSCNRTHARSNDVPCTHTSYTLCYVLQRYRRTRNNPRRVTAL